MSRTTRSVTLVTLGCARNEVDSEELAGRLQADGWSVTDDDAEVVVVNTCGFVDSAKKDSIDAVLAAADGERKVVAVGCLAERYGAQLADALTEADAVLGFDSYADIAARLDDVAAGRPVAAHSPRDRRTLLPVAPAERVDAAAEVSIPGHAWLPSGSLRRRLDDGPTGYLKLASGCDRRCAFCAIPSFRGSFVSRPPAEVISEARWLAEHGARELVLISENSTSYGKDLGNLRALEQLLPELAGVEGIERVRVSYLQPAELRPSLIDVLAGTSGVVPYFDLSFQHASAAVLRRMRRFGSAETFLGLLARIRELAPDAGARTNVIVGFPGESEQDLAELESFLGHARLDAIGVFGYSDEENTEAATHTDKHSDAEIAARVDHIASLADELAAQRAQERIGGQVQVLIEESSPEGVVGRAAHQGPGSDGTTTVRDVIAQCGAFVPCTVNAADGADLVASASGDAW